jgi:glycyl-tRNA synthetase beta chain
LVEIAQDTLSSGQSKNKADPEIRAFLERRVRFLLQKDGVPYDIVNAVFANGIETVHDVVDRAEALQAIRGEPDFEALATSYKRIKNILTKQEMDSEGPKSELLVEAEESELYSAYEQLRPKVLEKIDKGDYLGALRAMAGIRGVVDRFFDKVLVMAEEAELRNNRLSLLKVVSNVFLLIADISEIVQEGDQNG